MRKICLFNFCKQETTILGWIYIRQQLYPVSLDHFEIANLGICYPSLEIRSQHYIAQTDYSRMLNTLTKIVCPPLYYTASGNAVLSCYV